MNKQLNDKLKVLTSNIPSKWEEEALWREENKAWLERSAAIALKVLRELRTQSLSQKDLAIRLNVSAQQVNKWLKGQENLSLSTISKMEEALDIILVEIPSQAIYKVECASNVEHVVLKKLVTYNFSDIITENGFNTESAGENPKCNVA